MQKTRVRVTLILLAVIIGSSSFTSVVFADIKRRYEKELNNNKSLSLDLERFKNEAIAEQEKTKQEYKEQMANSESKYKSLLAQQPNLIKSHSRSIVVQDGTTQVQTSPTTSSSNSGGSSSSTKTSSKKTRSTKGS